MNYVDDIAERIRRQVPAHLLPDRDTTELFRIYAVLALALGPQVQLADVHNAWAAWMAAAEPDHPSVKPFKDLPPEVRDQDAPFVDAIRRVARELEHAS